MSITPVLHDFFSPFISIEAAGKLYLVAGLIFAMWYVPQIIRLMRDTTGAAAMSLNTMLFQFIMRFPGLLFSALIMQDVSFWVIFMDTAGRAVVLAIASVKRVKFHRSVGDEGSLLHALSPIDMDSSVAIESEKRKHQTH